MKKQILIIALVMTFITTGLVQGTVFASTKITNNNIEVSDQSSMVPQAVNDDVFSKRSSKIVNYFKDLYYFITAPIQIIRLVNAYDTATSSR